MVNHSLAALASCQARIKLFGGFVLAIGGNTHLKLGLDAQRSLFMYKSREK